jgi:transposase InsO family protein
MLAGHGVAIPPAQRKARLIEAMQTGENAMQIVVQSLHANTQMSYEEVLAYCARYDETDPFLKLCHRRLGHYPMEQIKAAYMRGTLRGVPVQRALLARKAGVHRCLSCDLAKATRVFHPRAIPDPLIPRAVMMGDCIVCDTHLFMSIPARDGSKMVLNLTDVATKMVWSFRMQAKSEALAALQHFYGHVRTEGKFQWKRFHSDSAGELLSLETKEWFRSVGIAQEFSPVDTPDLNAVAERMNRELGELDI